MLGAIAGDIIGSPFERSPVKTRDVAIFAHGSCFTDDTVMTVAVADWILGGGDLVDALKRWYARHPHVGYGKIFAKWAQHPTDRDPYNSWGNGSAMRVAPVAWARDSLSEVEMLAEATARVTHDHPEGLCGARVVAGAVFLARTGAGKKAICDYAKAAGYAMDRRIDDIRPGYAFDVSCRGSVPEAIISYLEGDCFIDCIRNAVSLGGDADTQACIAGAIAEGEFGLPGEVEVEALRRLSPDLRLVTDAFIERYVRPRARR